MKTASIDSIVRGYLFDVQLPIHYYAQCLNYALDCAQEIGYDTLPSIKSVDLTINEFAEATLPTDYVDFISVSVKFGQYLVPLVYRPSINRLPNLDDLGAQIPYESEESLLNSPEFLAFWDYHSQYGAHTYVVYGLGQGIETDVFNIIEERNIIQVYAGKTNGSTIHLRYIGFDEATAVSTVSKYAEQTVKAFINWKFHEQQERVAESRKERLKRHYYNELRKLRARLNPIDKELILRIARRSFKQSVKT